MGSSKDLSMDQSFLQSLKEIVLCNLENEQFGAEHLSKEIGLSRSQVHRKLQKIVGKSITQFIREIRLNVALDLLKKEVGTAAEISYRVGFSSPAYFTKCFHDYFGYPPGEVKKTSKKNPFSRKSQLNPDKLTHSKFAQKIKASSRPGILAIILYAFVLAMLFMSIYTFFGQLFIRSQSSPFAAEKTMAVIVFDDESSDPESEYFCTGMMEEILVKLQNINELNVLSRMTTERYRNSTLDPRDISKALDVEYILLVSTRKWESNFRISLELINGNTGFPLWSESYDEEMKDIFSVQADIALKVIRSLEITLSDNEEEQISSFPGVSVTAYDYILQGRDKQSKYWFGGDTTALREAEILYNKVLKLDPSYAPAWMRKGSIYYDRHQFTEAYFEKNFLDSTLWYCDTAIALNPKYGHPYLLKGWVFHTRGGIDLATENYKKALDLIQNNDVAIQATLTRLGYLYLFQKRYLEGMSFIMKAIPVARGSTLYYRQSLHKLGQAYLFIGAFDRGREYLIYSAELGINSCVCYCRSEAIQGHFKSSIDCLPPHCQTDTLDLHCNDLLANAYFQMRDYEKSLKYFQRYRGRLDEMGRFQFDNLYREGIALIELGNNKEGMKFIEKDFSQLEKRKQLGRSDDHDYHLAAIHAYRGNKEKAISCLRDYDNQVLRPNAHIIPISFAEHDILFEHLWDDPEFKAIIKLDKDRKAKARARILEMEEHKQHDLQKSANP